MSFTDQDKIAVWQKGQVCQGFDPAVWRKDQCSAWIGLSFYGNRESDYGWEIDHISPNGGDFISNLRPLHWVNNVEKSDGNLSCPITSSGLRNIRKQQ
jgi:hypothetical protein